MSTTFNLQRLLELAAQQSNLAAASLGTLNRTVVREQQKLTLLMRYRSEYQQRLRSSIEHGVDGASLRNFHHFLDRLEQAIVQQQHVVADSQTKAAGGRHEWQKKQSKYKAFDTLSQRFHAAVRRKDAKREQKIQDEFAGRRHRTGGSGTHR